MTAKTDDKGEDKPKVKTDDKGEDKPKVARLEAGFVRIRTEHPKRFGHVSAYGNVFGPEPKTFKPGELSEDALRRLKADPLLVVEEG